MNKDPLAWGRYVAIAAAYAACYELTRYFSFSHWVLPAGLRLSCLLLVPRRYWPALAVGEALPIAEMAALHAPTLGVLWAIVISIPTILLCMPAVAWLRSRADLRLADGQINMGFIMAATLACALISALASSAALATVVMKNGTVPPPVTAPTFLGWLLGAYLGALTLTPTIMALNERTLMQPGGYVTFKALRQSRLVRDALFIVVPSLALLLLAASQTTGPTLQYIRMAMALPVIVLTLRHGWHGSAIGGMLASIAMASTSFELRDPSMIQAQVILAFAISTCLMFGVRVARRSAANHPAPTKA